MPIQQPQKANPKAICDLWLPLEDLAETVAHSMIAQANVQHLSTITLDLNLDIGDHQTTDTWEISFIAKKATATSCNEKSYHPDFIRTVDEVKQILYQQGYTVKDWAIKHGYKPVQVYRVLRGENKALYGEGHQIAVAIGLKSA